MACTRLCALPRRLLDCYDDPDDGKGPRTSTAGETWGALAGSYTDANNVSHAF